MTECIQKESVLVRAPESGFLGLIRALLRHAERCRPLEPLDHGEAFEAFLFALGAAFDEAQRDGSVCVRLDAVMGALSAIESDAVPTVLESGVESILSASGEECSDAPAPTEEALLALGPAAPTWSMKLAQALLAVGRLSAVPLHGQIGRLRSETAAGLARLARCGLLGDGGALSLPQAPHPFILDVKAGLPLSENPDDDALKSASKRLSAVLERMHSIDALRLYCARDALEESQLAQKLVELAQSGAKRLKPETAERIEALAASLGNDQCQKDALTLAVKQRFAVICGGPGTGKTTTVIQILECLFAENPNLTVALAAPTGKAAGRMRQSINAWLARGEADRLFPHVRAAAEAGASGFGSGRIREHTIHKWLTIPTPSGERPGPDAPLAASVLIVDEASMMDIHLASRLFSAVGGGTRVVVLGDMHQLAAVGPGAVFADMSDEEGGLGRSVVRLRTSRRFPAGTVIDRLARAINHEPPSDALHAGEEALGGLFAPDEDDAFESVKAILAAPSSAADKYSVSWDQGAYDAQTGLSPAAVGWLEDKAKRFIAALLQYFDAVRRGGDEAEAAWNTLWHDALGSFRALAAQRRGPMSVDAVNGFMAAKVREAIEGTPFAAAADDEFYAGRVVIVRRNDDMLGLFNGDIGIVVPVRGGRGEIVRKVRFGDSGTALSPTLLPAHDTAYAMTVHQSQGSEFDDVAVFLPVNPESGLATRELLYTGVTRTKSTAAIFGSSESLRRAVETPTIRAGGLAERLKEAAGKRARP